MSITKVSINDESDVIVARMEARQMAKKIGFGTVDQARISLAASELARLACATINHSGEIVISNTVENKRQGMQVVCLVDMKSEGVAQSDPLSASSEIMSEQLKFRRGLASVSRLVDESVLDLSESGQASVTLIKWFT